MTGRVRAAVLAVCLATACGRGESPQPPAAREPVPAPIEGRIDPAPYRAQIEATEAVLYGNVPGDERWKNLSKALLELHNEIVFRDSSELARKTSRRLFLFSAEVDAAPTGKHDEEQLEVMRGVWEKIRADQFARADWFHSSAN